MGIYPMKTAKNIYGNWKMRIGVETLVTTNERCAVDKSVSELKVGYNKPSQISRG